MKVRRKSVLKRVFKQLKGYKFLLTATVLFAVIDRKSVV